MKKNAMASSSEAESKLLFAVVAMAITSYLGTVGRRGWPEVVTFAALSISAYVAQRLVDRARGDGSCNYYRQRQRPAASSGLLLGSVSLPLALLGLSIGGDIKAAANQRYLSTPSSGLASRFNLWVALACGGGIIATFLLLEWVDNRNATEKNRDGKDFDWKRTTCLSLQSAGCILGTCGVCVIAWWSGSLEAHGGALDMIFWLMLHSCLCARLFHFLLTMFPSSATAGEGLLAAEGMSFYLLDAVMRTLGMAFPGITPMLPSQFAQLGHCNEPYLIMQAAVIGVLAVAWISSFMHSWIELASFSSAALTPNSYSAAHCDACSSESSHCRSSLQLHMASTPPCTKSTLMAGDDDRQERDSDDNKDRRRADKKVVSSDHSLKVMSGSDGVLVGEATTFYGILVIVLAAAPSWLQFVCTWKMHPVIWVLQFVFSDPSLVRPILCGFWIACILGSVCVLSRMAKSSQVPRILLRKGFHLVATVMFMPALLLEWDFLALAFGIALAAFLLLEIIRVRRIPPYGDAIHSFYAFFTDSRDSGQLIVSHISLLMGCALPVWMSSSPLFNKQMSLAPFAGILAIGIGDTMASLVGFCYGQVSVFKDGKKTVEGTIAGITSMLLGCGVLAQWIPQYSALEWAKITVATVCAGLMEAFTLQLDNLFIPVIYFALLCL